MIFMTLAK